jgi:hypothetical protein
MGSTLHLQSINWKRFVHLQVQLKFTTAQMATVLNALELNMAELKPIHLKSS